MQAYPQFSQYMTELRQSVPHSTCLGKKGETDTTKKWSR